MRLDDLNFTGDLAFQPHTHEQMQVKTTSVARTSASAGLSTGKEGTKDIKYNTKNTKTTMVDWKTLQDVKSSTYLGSIINERARPDTDVNARIGKGKAAFLQLNNKCNSK
ncbi:unnamed protein product [Schistosoma curassoni]|uniref:Uncharacterized protein n=1 Tax=Schistosoma curassoni TaxID=6186 RepID=A0A183KJY5_9TREM|nr:unnamed protein product [Schistosoma curassoni]